MEQLRLCLEITSTNFFNHPNWDNPGLNISSPTDVGVISSAGATCLLWIRAAPVRSVLGFGWSGSGLLFTASQDATCNLQSGQKSRAFECAQRSLPLSHAIGLRLDLRWPKADGRLAAQGYLFAAVSSKP